MRYGVISDIHGNLEAFETVMRALSREKVDAILCAGDVVGYGADPVACIEKVRSIDPIIVCGNHDAACANQTDIRYFNEAAREAVLWTQTRLGESDITFLKGLDLVYRDEHVTSAHGTLQEPPLFHYMFTAEEAYTTFEMMQTRVCFVGHSHVPGIFLYRKEKIDYFYEDRMRVSKNEKVIVNAGSIGQPRDGDPRLCYSVYDAAKGIVELKKLSYDIETAQKKIRDAGLPDFLADRLGRGV
jgi:putative phosphoesterase